MSKINLDGLDEIYAPGMTTKKEESNSPKVDTSALNAIYNKLPVPSEAPKETPSTLSDAEQGAEKGMGGDIIAGGEQSILDSIMGAAHNMAEQNDPAVENLRKAGININPKASPTQVNAALKSMGAKGDIGPTTPKQMYRQAQGEQEQQYEDASKRSPYAFGAAELGSGLLAIGSGESALSAMGVPTKILAAAPKEAGWVEKGLTHVVNAAPVGVVGGTMSSKGHLIGGTPQEQAKVLKDAATGGLTTSALVGGGLLLGKGAEALTGVNPIKKMAGYFNLGKEGADLSSDTAQLGTLERPETLNNPVSMHSEQAANHVLDNINHADDFLGKQVGETIDKATQQGIRIQARPELAKKIDDVFGSLSDINLGETSGEEGADFSNREFKDFFDFARKLKEEGLTPAEAQQFRNELGNFGRQVYMRDQYAANKAFGLTTDLTNLLKQSVPHYAENAERLSSFRKMIPETILSKDNPIDVTNLRMSGIRNVDTKILNNLKTMIRGVYGDNMNAKASYSNLLQGIQELNKQELLNKAEGKIPETIFDTMKWQPEEIENFLKTNAYKSKLIQDYTGIPDVDLTHPLQTIGKGAGYIANKAGALTRNATKSPVVNIGKKLFAASDEALKSFTPQLSGIPGGKHLADALDKAIENKNIMAKNAILFSIIQNPNLRGLLESDNLGLEPRK